MNTIPNLKTLKATWDSYSRKKKYIIAGGAFLLLAGLANLQHQDGPMNGQGFGRTPMGYQANTTQGAYMSQGMRQHQEGQAYGYATAPGYANTAAASGLTYNHPDTTDLNSSYAYRNQVEDNASHNFQNYQLDRTDVQDAATGEVSLGVSNTYADPAIASGAYEAAPAPAAEPSTAPSEENN